MVKKAILIIMSVVFAISFASCNKEEEMNYQIKSVMNYKVYSNEAVISGVADTKLWYEEKDVRRFINFSANGCNLVSATYDRDKREITCEFSNGNKSEFVSLSLEVAGYPHRDSTAEATLKSLESRAVAAKEGQTVLIGDSLFANWKTADADMNAFGKTFNFGVGGFCASDLVNIVLERLVLPVYPSKVIVHCGVNDIFQGGISLETYIEQIKGLIDKIQWYLPSCNVYFVSIVRPTDFAPTVTGIKGKEADDRRNAIDEANRIMKEYCADTGKAFYVDAEGAYLNAAGRSDEKKFYHDGIHLLAEVYPEWGMLIAKGTE